jgi:hypothetical protein
VSFNLILQSKKIGFGFKLMISLLLFCFGYANGFKYITKLLALWV